MSLLVAGPDGEIDDGVLVWDVVSFNPGLPPVGRMDEDASTPTFVAPNQVPEEPALALVQVQVTTGGVTLTGQKGVVVGPLVLRNPTLTSFTAGTTDLLTDDLRLAPGETVTLDLAIEPEADKDTTYSWYSTLGTIDRYRSSPTELLAPDEPGTGWLFAVVRDARGGIVWHKTRVVVE